MKHARTPSMTALVPALVLLTGAAVLQVTDCTPAQQAQAIDISKIVGDDILAGKSYAEIEADVTAALKAMDADVLELDVAAVIEDAILLLVDLKRLAPWVLTSAVGDGGLPSVLATAHARRRPAK